MDETTQDKIFIIIWYNHKKQTRGSDFVMAKDDKEAVAMLYRAFDLVGTRDFEVEIEAVREIRYEQIITKDMLQAEYGILAEYEKKQQSERPPAKIISINEFRSRKEERDNGES